MAYGKFIIYAWLMVASVFAHASKCGIQLQNRLTERGKSHFYSFANTYFSELGPDRALHLGAIVMDNPGENLSIMLDLVRGEKDAAGNWTKKPLSTEDLDKFLQKIVPVIGVDAIPRIYNDWRVQRDPNVFYQMASSLAYQVFSNQVDPEEHELTPEVRALLTGKTIN